MKVNVADRTGGVPLLQWILEKIDTEALYAVYWEQRKESHKGKLPIALEYPSWSAFCEDDPDGATAFIAPFQVSLKQLQSLFEGGDVDETLYDLVPSGSWVARQQVSVAVAPRLQEVKSVTQMTELFHGDPTQWRQGD